MGKLDCGLLMLLTQQDAPYGEIAPTVLTTITSKMLCTYFEMLKERLGDFDRIILSVEKHFKNKR